LNAAVGDYDGLVGSAIVQAKGKVILKKGNYTLALAYDTLFATSMGRFTEMIRVPWLSDKPDSAESCALYLSHHQLVQTSKRGLKFVNLSVDL
jgi:hypothetical protein